MAATLQDALLELKLAEAADLAALEAWAPYRGLPLAERLFRSGLVSDEQLVAAFARLGAIDATHLVLAGLPPAAALGAFSRPLAAKYRALPLSVDKRRLIVALLDPSDAYRIEKLTFSCGLIIEPRACRPGVLFDALARAYDVPPVLPDGAFRASRRPATLDLEIVVVDETPAQTKAEAIGERRASSKLQPIDDTRDLRPARTPLIDASTLSQLVRNPPLDLLAARDSLPAQILPLLVPPLRTCALFLVRKNVAVGWDVKTDDAAVGTLDIRDILLPLSAPSVLAEAVVVRRASHGNPRDPTTMERTLFRFLRRPPPRAFAALPVLTGDEVIAVLYLDRNGPIDDALVDEVRRAGAALGDALAPLAAAGGLFPPPTLPPVGPKA